MIEPTHYVLKRNGVRHAVKHGEKEALCGHPISGGERCRDLQWYGQVNCRICRRTFATTPGRCIELGEEEGPQPLREYLEELFNIDIERRMRTAIFVRALFPELSEREALEKLRDPEFLAFLLNLLTNYSSSIAETAETVEQAAEKVKALFSATRIEEEE